RGVSAARLTALQDVRASLTQNTAALRTPMHATVNGPPPLANREPEPIDLADFDKALVTASADRLARTKRLIKIVEEARLTPAADLIVKYNASADAAARARLLVE